jgi:hypothetical protein
MIDGKTKWNKAKRHTFCGDVTKLFEVHCMLMVEKKHEKNMIANDYLSMFCINYDLAESGWISEEFVSFHPKKRKPRPDFPRTHPENGMKNGNKT